MNKFEFIRFALSNNNIKSIPSFNISWSDLLDFAHKQSILGILYRALEKLKSSSNELGLSEVILMKWIGYSEIIQKRNIIVNKRVVQLTDLFSKGGYRTCVLKGQGNALYYPNPSLRSSGDIDLWVEGDRNKIVEYIRSLGIKVHDVHLVHADADFFDDVHVEVHFQPSWFYNPFTERKLLLFFKEQAKEQFRLFDTNVGYTHPSLYFNLVFNLIHINRHIFDEGIGLRQIVDYFYILQASDKSIRENAMEQIKFLKLAKFTSALMYVMREALGMDDDLLLCKPNEKIGKRLLKDILEGGNFGKYGKYARTTTNDQRFKRSFDNLKRNWQFITTYPEEVLWIPYFKVWHWVWRKCKGYL